MSRTNKIFKKTFRRHFTNHEANFPPAKDLRIGDFGEMRNGDFVRLGNIKSLANPIIFNILTDDASSHEQFQSSKNVQVNFKAKGDVELAGTSIVKAHIEIKFQSENAFYFNSANVKYLQMDDLYSVGEQLKERYLAGKWNKRHLLVSRIIEGENTLMISSSSSNAEVLIEAESAEIVQIDLADVGVGLNVSLKSGSAYIVSSAGKMQIGLGFSRVYNTIFNGPLFGRNETLTNEFVRLDNESEDKAIAFGDVILEESIADIA